MRPPAPGPGACPATAGTVERLSFHCALMGGDWRYVIYRPPGHDAASAPCPALYMLHGSYGAPDDFIDHGGLHLVADGLIAAGRIPPTIIAMPDGRETWYVNQPSGRIEDAILDEFIPRIERQERVIAARPARAIGGLSMGGYGALRLALKHPGLFGAAALLSPAIYAGAPGPDSSARACAAFCPPGPDGAPMFDPAAWQREHYDTLIAGYFASAAPARFYIECGDGDEFGLAGEAARLFGVLRGHGVSARFRLSSGGHDWPTWTRAFERALPCALASSIAF